MFTSVFYVEETPVNMGRTFNCVCLCVCVCVWGGGGGDAMKNTEYHGEGARGGKGDF